MIYMYTIFIYLDFIYLNLILKTNFMYKMMLSQILDFNQFFIFPSSRTRF